MNMPRVTFLPSTAVRRRLRMVTGTAICVAGAAQILDYLARILF
ncbi:MAG: hypothetical protein ACHP7E_02870 [Burkholderiales bacterium]